MEIKPRNGQKLDESGNKIKAGQITVEKVGELYLRESLAIELKKWRRDWQFYCKLYQKNKS